MIDRSEKLRPGPRFAGTIKGKKIDKPQRVFVIVVGRDVREDFLPAVQAVDSLV